MSGPPPSSGASPSPGRRTEAERTAWNAFKERMFRRRLALVDVQLDANLRQKLDPEDVVQSVLRSFFRRYPSARFDPADPDALWPLLAQIALRKCLQKRD